MLPLDDVDKTPNHVLPSLRARQKKWGSFDEGTSRYQKNKTVEWSAIRETDSTLLAWELRLLANNK